jgi:tetratricopeptide (TPR) repeat protein
LEVAYAGDAYELSEELADLLAVAKSIVAVSELKGWDEVEEEEAEKRRRRGGFEARLYLTATGYATGGTDTFRPGGAPIKRLKSHAGVRIPLVPPLLNLGLLHSDQNRMDESREAIEEALKTYRELAKTNPESYLPYVAGTLNNLGVLHRDQNGMNEARQAFEEALKTRRELAKTNPETYLPDVAKTLNNLRRSAPCPEPHGRGPPGLRGGAAIYERFAKRNPDRFAGDVARVQQLLAELER